MLPAKGQTASSLHHSLTTAFGIPGIPALPAVYSLKAEKSLVSDAPPVIDLTTEER
jgi:hypothetical protein